MATINQGRTRGRDQLSVARRVALGCACLALLFASTAASAQEPASDTREPPPRVERVRTARLVGEARGGAQYGWTVAMSANGEYAAVGSRFAGVRIFSRVDGEWRIDGEWRDPRVRNGTLRLAIDAQGSLVVVSLVGPARGLQVLERREHGWVPTSRFATREHQGDDWFGTALALAQDGSCIVVGAPYRHTHAGRAAGAAWVFRRMTTGWDEESLPAPSGGTTADNFGAAVATDATCSRVLVGAPRAEAAFVYEREEAGTWTEQARIAAVSGARGDRFGAAVALDSESRIALIGAPSRDVEGERNAGAVLVYERSEDTWSLRDTWVGAPRTVERSFGRRGRPRGLGAAVQLAAGRAIVSDLEGRAHLYVRGARWHGTSPLLPSRSRMEGGVAPTALSADGRWALLGVPTDDPNDVAAAGSVEVVALSDDAGRALPAAPEWSHDPFERERARSDRQRAREEALALRLAVQVPVALAFAAGQTALVALAVVLGRRDVSSVSDGFGLVFGTIGLGLGIAAVTVLSVSAITGLAEAMGGRGNFGWACLGYAIGAAVGAAVLVGGVALGHPGGRATADADAILLGAGSLASVLAAGGAILAYSLADQGEHARHDMPDVLPVAAVSPSGGHVGIVTTF